MDKVEKICERFIANYMFYANIFSPISLHICEKVFFRYNQQ